jgi:hypothetical protein
MPKSRQRACLQHGLKLDLNRLARQGLVKPGAQTGPFHIRWTDTSTGGVAPDWRSRHAAQKWTGARPNDCEHVSGKRQGSASRGPPRLASWALQDRRYVTQNMAPRGAVRTVNGFPV